MALTMMEKAEVKIEGKVKHGNCNAKGKGGRKRAGGR